METNEALTLILSELKNLKQEQQRIEAHLKKHDNQLASIVKSVNVTNNSISKINEMVEFCRNQLI